MHSHKSFLLQQAVLLGGRVGPPSPEVSEAFKSGGPVSVSVVSGVVTHCGHQEAPRIHPASTFRCLCRRVDCFHTQTCTFLSEIPAQNWKALCSQLLPSRIPFILTFSLSQTTATTTPHPSSLLAECILQSPCSVLRQLLVKLDLSGLDHNVAPAGSSLPGAAVTIPPIFQILFQHLPVMDCKS